MAAATAAAAAAAAVVTVGACRAFKAMQLALWLIQIDYNRRSRPQSTDVDHQQASANCVSHIAIALHVLSSLNCRVISDCIGDWHGSLYDDTDNNIGTSR
jgi:hypothetical protein